MVETFYRLPGAPFLALLSDLHNRPYSSVIDSLRVHRPDLICITGDVLYGSHPGEESPLRTQTNVMPFFRACGSIAPTYFSLGNHEWMLDAADILEIERTGVSVLDNRWIKKDGLVIGGLTSGRVLDYRQFVDTLSPSERAASRYPKKSSASMYTPSGEIVTKHKPDTAWLDDFCSIPGYHILLSHHPEYISLIPPPVNLVLSGHAHGGQVRLFNHGLFAPGQGVWPKLTKGVYDGRLVVSAGLSNTTRIPRINNPTEVVYVRS